MKKFLPLIISIVLFVIMLLIVLSTKTSFFFLMLKGLIVLAAVAPITAKVTAAINGQTTQKGIFANA